MPVLDKLASINVFSPIVQGTEWLCQSVWASLVLCDIFLPGEIRTNIYWENKGTTTDQRNDFSQLAGLLMASIDNCRLFIIK